MNDFLYDNVNLKILHSFTRFIFLVFFRTSNQAMFFVTEILSAASTAHPTSGERL